ncbi:MAG: hypothetical protein RSA79_03300 [Oscillospiraceae bacterium]
MQFNEGMIVKSCAGHDQNLFYVIAKIENDKIFIADGKRRKLKKPKLKNQIHLAKTNTILEKSDYQTDLKLRRILMGFNNPLKNQNKGR